MTFEDIYKESTALRCCVACCEPLVSVIMPVYNGERFIEQAINSLLEQSCDALEAIIVDDGSSDRTVEIVEGYEDERIHLLKIKNNIGPAHARNIGLKIARGKWIGFIDSDDYWEKDRLLKLLEVAKMHKDCCISSDVMVCLSGRKGELIPVRSICQQMGFKDDIIQYNTMFDYANYGFDLKPICPRSLLEENKIAFNDSRRGSEWREFIFRLLHAGSSILVINQPLYRYRVTTSSLSSSYRTVKNEILTTEYLIKLSWIDKKTKAVLYDFGRKGVHRLLTTSLREHRWKEALNHFLESPHSILYLLKRSPTYLIERVRAWLGN